MPVSRSIVLTTARHVLRASLNAAAIASIVGGIVFALIPGGYFAFMPIILGAFLWAMSTLLSESLRLRTAIHKATAALDH